MANGYIYLQRKIQDCWIWQNEVFSRGQAWIDLLLLAEWKDRKKRIGNDLVTVKRGSFHLSILILADRWKWSRNRVRRFLAILEEDGMITTERTPYGTTVTIVKYEDYQIARTPDEPTPEPPNEPTDEPTDEPQMNKYNKDNKYIYNVEFRSRIIDYLNQKCGTRYKASTANTKKHIDARLNEGYTYEDFVKVIDKKYDEWNGTQMEQYLRPDTLFGTKFESYLNQNIVKGKPASTQFHGFEQNKYDFNDLENRLLNL